jgi:2-polyprenyl-6-methoxyphenol hydroxylase-like FAD-dependent oxidoreductase
VPPQSDVTTSETLPPRIRVHVIGAGPVGLLLTALLQSTERFAVQLYEKRRDYTRTPDGPARVVPRRGFGRELL